ncbi:MAG: ACT domain-containing protein [Phycisphaerales bacterium JB054]
MDRLDYVIRSSPVVLHPDRYAYLAVDELPVGGEHLMVYANGVDRTVVTREALVPDVPHLASESWFRLLECETSTPFETPGLLARITGAVASAGLNVLILSTFSRDCALVRDHDLDAALDALRAAGFEIRTPG